MAFKKSLAFVSAAAVAFSAIAPAATFAASPFVGFADKLAAANVINTQTSEAGYRLSDKITRAEVAKIAAKAAGLAEVPSAQSFNDVSAEFAGYVGALVKAGAVNGSAVSFRSGANITRFEALKILVKAAGVSVTEASSSSFADVPAGEVRNVVEAALSQSLISKNSAFRPNDSITRGEFFKIASGVVDMKASAVDNGSDDLGALLGGLFGDTATGTTTSTSTSTSTSTTVAAGQLQLSLNNASPAGIQIPQTGIVRFAIVDVAAGASDITLNSIEIKKVGLASVDSSTKVWFEKNGLRLTGKSSFTSEGNVVVSFAPAFVVKAGTVESLDLEIELAGSNNAGTDFQFTSGNVVSSAAKVTGSFTTNVLRAANYSVATHKFDGVGSNTLYKASNDLVELGAFTIEATKPSGVTETRDEVFQSITLSQSGSASLTNLTDIVLVRNGNVVSKSVIVDAKNLTFSVVDTIKDGTIATYYVKARIANVENATDVYNFRLKNSSDINVIEANTGFRTTTNFATSLAVDGISAVYTVNGGDVKFERDGSVALSSNVAPGTQVVLMQGTITAKNAVRLEDIAALTATVSTGGLQDYFNTLYLQIGSSTFSSTATGTSMEFNGSVTIQGSAAVKLYGTLKSTSSVPAGSIKFADLTLNSFTTKEYVANQENVSSSVGSIPGITVTVNTTNLNLTRNDGLGNTTLASGAKGVTVLGASLSSTKGNPVSVTSATYKFTGSGSFVNNAFATLYVDGAMVDSKTVDGSGTEIKFNLSPNAIVSTSKAVNFVVKVDFTDAFTGGAFQAQLFSVDATDTVSSKAVTITALTDVNFTVATANATLAASDSNPQAKLLLGGSLKNQLFAFKMTAVNDAVKIKDLTLSGTKLDQLSNFRLTDASGNVLATSSVASASQVKFESAQASAVAQDKSAIYFVVADANSNTNTGGIQLALSGAVVTGTNGADISVTSGSIESNVHAVADNVGVIAKASNGSKELTTSALRFTVAVDAGSKNQLTLSGITLTAQLSGYTGSAVVNVYKTDTSASNLIGTGAAGTSQVIALTGTKAQVDAGSTVTYVVTVEGVVADSASNTRDWTVKLEDVDLGTTAASANDYVNLGTFPITEVK